MLFACSDSRYTTGEHLGLELAFRLRVRLKDYGLEGVRARGARVSVRVSESTYISVGF